MCCLETEGTHHGCGHYIQTRVTRKIDCGERYCMFSQKHPANCQGNRCHCTRFYGPDAKETVTAHDRGWCPECQPWLGKGR